MGTIPANMTEVQGCPGYTIRLDTIVANTNLQLADTIWDSSEEVSFCFRRLCSEAIRTSMIPFTAVDSGTTPGPRTDVSLVIKLTTQKTTTRVRTPLSINPCLHWSCNTPHRAKLKSSPRRVVSGTAVTMYLLIEFDSDATHALRTDWGSFTSSDLAPLSIIWLNCMQPLGFYGIYTPPSDCSGNLVLQL